MGSISVDHIQITPLRRILLDGGDVLHGMKYGDPGYVDFGEVYFSQIDQGAVKAWKRHLRMTLNLVVPYGEIYFVFIDDQGNIREEAIGLSRYARLTIPPGLWFGFKGRGESYSLLMNVADIPHDPAEIERKKLTEIEFNWESK